MVVVWVWVWVSGWVGGGDSFDVQDQGGWKNVGRRWTVGGLEN